jgi:hypothetical protein
LVDDIYGKNADQSASAASSASSATTSSATATGIPALRITTVLAIATSLPILPCGPDAAFVVENFAADEEHASAGATITSCATVTAGPRKLAWIECVTSSAATAATTATTTTTSPANEAPEVIEDDAKEVALMGTRRRVLARRTSSTAGTTAVVRVTLATGAPSPAACARPTAVCVTSATSPAPSRPACPAGCGDPENLPGVRTIGAGIARIAEGTAVTIA